MSDLKEFWDKEEDTFQTLCCAEEYWKTLTTEEQKIYRTLIDGIKYRQGLFFWERGGKQFVLSGYDIIREGIDEAITITKNDYMQTGYMTCTVLQAQDFLDCVACLGEDKVKELIEGLK